ncbi:N-acetylglucosamine-6-phosphate 2-epimerase and phosphatase [Vibrio crassostreae]|uniref:N-acetylglucosamine-6-phosphate 2-epimerase and phosphatase n=1 Tax=Vibrio crassostreae TaxID=246167 RepID=A0A822N7F5_9VIBR|nr:UDP-N-acetylglucosamine 2-epimerase [Vibrio crassostreae]MDH5950703.1 UDP-N-acetylglucosamine 2-epimerase [Vibrio crassostreae]TCN07117.1 UDP-N-acetylglucosamine 2-epimerase (non-hydrolysing)/GDP/UDP-N,N'-diacetylbacillosamine 2-epimerase (hydrolysing) [Vibrio crassostreae]TCU07495.1 UDP-N-acetylglucosamine 2-epimerase (non-hydrolysing)/GDP/UDP-N,N'-diacetylbacillosamine 2-epimerase (hydrolysing) [Vibrio crassostreae]CAK2204154.1 N-acetylglucosamine-6-phosphate 2-epimerase and phosphatase [V
MKILALTSIRSEYDLLSSLFQKLHLDPNIDLQLLVGGAHNSPTFGLTRKDIEGDGFNILMNIESLLDADTNSSRLKSASILLMSSIEIVKQYSPDLIIYAGDREEVMIGALLGGYLSIPTLHFFGGDHASDGHIDNPIRHAVSKLSTVHFVSTLEHERRLCALGEPKQRIFNIGSVALDKFSDIPPSKGIVSDIALKEITRPIALFIFHPVEEELGNVQQIVRNTIDALIDEGFHVFVGKPNTDHGNTAIRDVIGDIVTETEHISVYGNLPRTEFVQLFKASQLIVGNSSAGLLEAASIPIACLNVGERQKGRFCGDNVVFVDANKESVLNGLKQIKTCEFQQKLSKVVNPYGDGKASEQAYRLITTTNFQSLMLKKEDPLHYDK